MCPIQISHQENELDQLQKAAVLLKNQLQTLNSVGSPAGKAETFKDSGKPGGQSSDPHQSLMGELSALNQDSEVSQLKTFLSKLFIKPNI